MARSSVYAWVICTAGALFYCYEYYLRITPSVMESDLIKFYHIDAGGFGNLSAFYYYAYTPMQFFVGILFDRFGVRNLVAVACAFCALGIYLFASSHYLALAGLGRFMIGFGSAFAFVGALKLASIWLPPQRFGFVAGLVTSLGMVGAIIGDVSLTEFVKYEGWRVSSYLMAGFGIVLAVLLFFIVRDRKNKRVEVCLQVKLNKRAKKEEAITFPELLRSLLQTMRTPAIWLNGIIGCCLFLSLTAFAELWAVPYFKAVYHLRPEVAALVNSVIFLGWAFGGPVMGFVSDWLQQRRKVLLLATVVAFLVSVLFQHDAHAALSLVYCACDERMVINSASEGIE